MRHTFEDCADAALQTKVHTTDPGDDPHVAD
jgi:hypothetical protein